MKKFLTRTLSGAVYATIVVGSIYACRWLDSLLGKIIFACVFLAVGIVGIYEYVNNLSKKGVACNRPMAYIAGIIVYLGMVVPSFQDGLLSLSAIHTVFAVGLVFAGLMPVMFLTVFALQLWRNDDEPFTTVGHTLIPSIWIMMPLALLNEVQLLGAGLTMMVFILIWVNDSFAYITGMLMGRTKMWERHSPNKTWEGTIGGALFCIVAAILVGPRLYPFIQPLGWAVIGLICSSVGTLGDLVESMFKRYCGVKDSGKIMPGHGGILDRFDSILMTVPFVLFFVTIITL